MSTDTLAKMAKLSKILESAQYLYNLDLIDKLPSDCVRQYVNEHPEINELLSKGKR